MRDTGNLSAGDLFPECGEVDDPELNIVEAVLRNVNYRLSSLDSCRKELFFEWLKNHTRLEAAHCETLDDCLLNWFQSLSKQQMLDEGFLIVSEIIWFKHRSLFESSEGRNVEC
jgi:hypothetical protein